MKKFIIAIAAIFTAFVANAQNWEVDWNGPDALKGIPGYYSYYFSDNNAGFMYFSHTKISGIVCKNGIFDYYGEPNYYIDIVVGFYNGTSLSYKTVYEYCPVKGELSDTTFLNSEETAPIWAWLNKGRNYSVRFIIERFNRSDLDFVVKGR